MRNTHIGPALVAAIIIATSCDENPNPVAPTPVPEPTRPREARTLEIIGIPETGLPIGETVQLTARIRRNDGGTETASNPLWTSSNPEIATIDNGGTLLGRREGRTVITASVQEPDQLLEASASAEITPDLWLEIIGIPATGLPVGESVQLKTRVSRHDGRTEATRPDQTAWTSSNPQIATVDFKDGTLLGCDIGRTEITATWWGPDHALRATTPAEITPGQPQQPRAFKFEDIVIGTGDAAVPGDRITIRYVAWLWECGGGDVDGRGVPENKGQQVDSGEFEFVMGVGAVLRAFEEGLVNMRVGGLRRMQVPPAYGLGGEGAGNIPPNSTLVIEMELLAVRPYVTDSAPFQIIDLKEGNGTTAANGDMLTIDYAGWLYDASEPDGKGRQAELNNEGFRFNLGRGDVIEGWDQGLPGMRTNGKRRLIIPPHLAYGRRGKMPQIPPHATLVYDITLRNVRTP